MDGWSELPKDAVGLITSFLSLADTHRFSAVCRNWCFVTKEKRFRPVPQLPWLVLTDNESTGKRMFFNMSENKYYHFDIPELRDAFIVGSSFGWLFAVGPRLDAHLVNPFSGDKISLPPLPNYEFWVGPQDLIDHVQRNIVQHFIVRKAILSSDPSRCTNFVVFIMLEGMYRLAFYKPGDTTWTVFNYRRGIFDIVCFKGQFYALLEDNVIGAIDIGPKPKIRRGAHRFRDPYDESSVKYLVDYNGRFLLLISRIQKEKGYHHFVTTGFHVFRIELESIEAWELKNLDDHALFLGRNESIVVHASDFNLCMENSIYFCDAAIHFPRMNHGYGDMGVYNLEDKLIWPFYQLQIYHSPQSIPIWLVPNTMSSNYAAGTKHLSKHLLKKNKKKKMHGSKKNRV